MFQPSHCSHRLPYRPHGQSNNWRRISSAAALALALWSFAPANSLAAEAAPPAGNAGTEETPYNIHLGPWKVMGPFTGGATQALRFQEDFLGAEGTTNIPDRVTTQGQTFTWHEVPRGALNFNLLFDSGHDFKNAVVYATTKIEATADIDARLALGVDDGMRGWLNGEQVIDSVMPSGVGLDDKVFPVKLRKGSNHLLLKVDNVGEEWGAIARLLPGGSDRPLLTMHYHSPVPVGIANLPDATVELLAEGGEALARYAVSGYRARTTNDGQYRLYAPLPSPQPARIRVTMEQPVSANPWTKEFSWAEATSGETRIGAPGDLSVRGRVVDVASSSPIASARLTFGDRYTSTVKTGADGAFTLSKLDPAFVRLTVNAPGHIQKIYQVGYAPNDPLEIALTTGGQTLRGRITNEKGEAVADAGIRVYLGSFETTEKTDAEGRYVISGIPENAGRTPGQKPTLHPVVQHSDYAPLDHFSVELTTGGVTEKDIQLNRGATVHGKVTAKADGRPLAGITIQQGKDRFGSNTAISEAKTDAEGKYRLTGLKTGDNYVHAFSPDWAPAMKSTTFRTGEDSDVDFQLEPGKPVRGRVVDSSGKPLSGVRIVTDTWEKVRMFQRETTTRPDGSFEFQNMPATPVESDFLKQGFTSARKVKLTGGDDDVVTTLALPAKVTGQVVDAETRQPIPEYEIINGHIFKSNSSTYWDSSPEKVSNADGTFVKTYDELSNHDARLRFKAPGYRAKELDTVVKAGDQVTSVMISLEKGSAIKGIVTDQSGNPVPGASVVQYSKEQVLWLGQSSGQTQGEKATANATGEFQFASIPNGKFHVYAEKEGTGAAFVHDLDEKSNLSNIVLEPFGSIAGFVFHGDTPSSKTSLTLLQGRSRDANMQVHYSATTQADGSFRVDNIPPGEYNLTEAIKSGETTMYTNQKPVTVSPGRETFIALGGEGGTRVQGAVRNEDSQPIAGATVRISDRGHNQSYSTATDEEGKYDIADVPPGKYNLTVDRYSRNIDRLYFSESVQVADQPKVQHDVNVTQPEELTKGDVLPLLEGKDEKKQPATLADTDQPRVLLLMAGPHDKESTEKFKAQLAAVAQQQSNMDRKKISFTLLVSPYAGKNLVEEALKETTATVKQIKLTPKWSREFSKKYKTTGDLNAFISDRQGKILAVLPNIDAIEATLKEME